MNGQRPQYRGRALATTAWYGRRTAPSTSAASVERASAPVPSTPHVQKKPTCVVACTSYVQCKPTTVVAYTSDV